MVDVVERRDLKALEDQIADLRTDIDDLVEEVASLTAIIKKLTGADTVEEKSS